MKIRKLFKTTRECWNTTSRKSTQNQAEPAKKWRKPKKPGSKEIAKSTVNKNSRDVTNEYLISYNTAISKTGEGGIRYRPFLQPY